MMSHRYESETFAPRGWIIEGTVVPTRGRHRVLHDRDRRLYPADGEPERVRYGGVPRVLPWSDHVPDPLEPGYLDRVGIHKCRYAWSSC